ncbi:TPA: type VI secretion system membrane subunit TssM [Escherichia coli]|nr:type VI secretion system membrane subunit TssM [Escherichia coli]
MLILAWIFLLVWIWWKGPTWTLYEEQWLKPLANRWLATAAWGIIALVWLTVRVMKRLQQLEKMQKQQREEAVDPLSVELNAQQRYLDRWLLRLQRHLDNRRFLWQLPWYMVIGPAGSGKTTLLREGFPSDIIYAPEGARGAEQRLYLTPHVGKQAVIFDIDGTLCAPADADILHRRLSHLDYALAHTDWHAERQEGDGDAISRWTPYDKPVVSAQKELSKLPVYQRVYQSLKTRALGVLPADLNLRDQVGPTFDQVFTSADDNKLVVPQFITRYGLQSYFVKQRDELVELTAMDSWVLNLTRNVKYSDADRAEIQHQLTEQYISDYTATWRAGMDNLNIRNFESIGQLTGALEQVISGDQPLQRALTVLRDNTQPGVFSEKLSAKEREEALAEPDYQLLTRLGHEFAPENSTLAVQKDKESTMQAVYQQLTELHRYLLAIQNAPVPGKSALKAVQLRLDQNSSDPIFATRQMAKTLPAPLNRWVGRLADQAWHVVMVEAVHYMEVDWRDSVVKPFNEQLANNYPFNPRSAQDASLDAFERFFKPDGILDTFYQQNLKLFIDNDLSLEDGDNNVIIREDIIAQLETAQKIRDIFFSKQNGLGTSFAVETVSLSGNKRRSVLNLDGQLVDYSQGRNYTAHLVWPNNMREGNESKLTLIGTSGNAPRSISFSGPWAQFRLFGAGQLTGVQDGNFTVRFSVDGGAMTYRVHTDTEDNPFSGGLFSQFGLSDTLY